MKTRFLHFSLTLILLSISNCNKSDEGPTKLDPEGDCFTAVIDGQAFNSDNVTGTDTGLLLTIGATLGTTTLQTFGINLTNTAAGTYPISIQPGTQVIAQYSEGPLTSQTIYAGVSGSLTIEEHNTSEKRIKGTFSFEGDDSTGNMVSITDGIFDLKYQ